MKKIYCKAEGDCLRACIASLTHCIDVPHFFHPDNVQTNEDVIECWKKLRDWLKNQSCSIFLSVYEDSLYDKKELLELMKYINPNINYILMGLTKNNEAHAVIYKNDKLVHNPSKTAGNVVKPLGNGYFVVAAIIKL